MFYSRLTLTPAQHHVVSQDKWASTCSTSWFPFGSDAAIANEGILTPFRLALVSLLAFGVFAFAAYRKYAQKKPTKRYDVMREDEVRVSMLARSIQDAHTTFSRLMTPSSTKRAACFLEGMTVVRRRPFPFPFFLFFSCACNLLITSDRS